MLLGRDMGVDVMILPKLAAEENPGKLYRMSIIVILRNFQKKCFVFLLS